VNPVVLVVAGFALAAFVVLALLRPQVSLLTLVVLDVSNLNGVLAEHLGTSPYRPQLALAVLVVVVLACRRQLRFAWSPVLLGMTVLMAGFCLSFVHAADPPTSWLLLGTRSRDLFYAVVVLALVLSTRSIVRLTQAAVLVLAALAGLTVVHEFVLGNAGDLFGLSRVPLVQEGGALTARHAGTSSDVNFWARLLILFTPLALSLTALALRPGVRTRGRWLWGGCVLSLLIGVYLTQSRGGFLALFAALVCWLLLAGGWWRRSILLLPVALAVVVPLSGIGSRLLTLVSSVGGASSSTDLSVLTRKRLQVDAWHMFLDSPAFGHGIGSYGTLFPAYDRLSDAYSSVDIVVAAHNFYLEQAADGGVILILAWAVLAGTVLFAAQRTRSITLASAEQASSKLLADGIIAGVVGWAVASVFLHLSDFRALLLVGVLAAALDVQARRSAVPGPPPVPVQRQTLRALLPAVGAALLVGAAGVGAVLAMTSTTYANTATLAVVPVTSTADGSNAYQVDVISRGVIVPTLAEVLAVSVKSRELQLAGQDETADLSVSVTQSRLGGSVVVSVSGRSAASVAAAGDRAVALSRSTVAGLNSSYAVTGEMTGVAPTREVPRRTALALLPAAVVGLLVWLRLRRRFAPAPRRAMAAEPAELRPAA